MSNYFNRAKSHFELEMNNFLQTESMKMLTAGGVTLDQYKSWLREVYYYVRENPQIQTFGAVYFRGKQRFMVRNVFKHALSEVGHEQLALNDYAALGGETKLIPYKNPLPSTTALTAFAYYQIHNKNPLGYLGYLFFLEFISTQLPQSVVDAFGDKVNVPDTAFTYLREHFELDMDHNRLIERYFDELVRTEADFEAIRYAMSVTANLFAKMVDGAIANVENPVDTGWAYDELAADGLTPESFVDDQSLQVA